MKKALMSRRLFTQRLMALLTLNAALPGCGLFGKPDQKTIIKYLINPLRHSDLYQIVGRRYLAAHPASREQLTRLILGRIGVDDAVLERSMLKQFESMLHSRIRRDFADESIFITDGWLLSQTEAMLCALAATQKRPAS